MTTPIKIFLFCLFCFAFIGCDQASKDIAKEHLKDKQPISYLHDTVRLQYVENTGAAMSFGDELPKTASLVLLSLLPLFLLIVVFVYAIKNAGQMSLMKLFSLALIFAGGIGNIIDRLLHDRHVPDFMNLGINNFRTGIFNVADVCVTTGVVGLLIFYKDRTKIAAIN
jgi:signal peptidase II